MAATRSLSAIEADIAATKEALANVKGTTTEVYARIVGYYRAVRNWNKGKRDEFNHRAMFVYDGEKEPLRETVSAPAADTEPVATCCDTPLALHYEFFMRQTCPNCPPVKNYMAEVTMEGRMVDVDTESGLSEAARKGVFSAPTVIFYGADGSEIGRAHNVSELKAILETEAVVA